jgi:hypothetical protein
MTVLLRRPALSATALLLLSAAPALAQVTAQDVWDDWKAQMDIYGEAGVTVGSEEYANGVLTVTDLGFTIAGEDGSNASGVLPQLTLTENGDGTVSASMSEEYPIRVVTPANAETGEPASDVALALRQTGMVLTVSGEPGALVYDLQASRYAVELDRVTQDGAEVPAEFTIALNDLSGSYTSTVGAMRDVTYDLAAASMDLLVDGTNPEDGSQFMFSGKIEDLTTQATMSMPIDPAADPEMMVMNGLAMDGGYTTGGGSYIFEFADAAGPTSGTLTTGGSSLDFAFSKDAMSYRSNATAIDLQATSAQMPLPISVQLAEMGATFEMPLAKSDTAAPWAMGVNLSGLAIDEQLWAMFDPQGMLSHDPATVTVDLTGTAKVLFDVLDPAQAEAMAAAAMPVEIESANLNALNVTFGGASVTGTGAFTFDNTDTTTFPGVPRPTGAVDLQMNGVNALIDTLVAMGLMPEEQVMGARMMLGMFTTAVGDDQLTSRIEVTPEGALLANGQRLQ